MTQHFSDWAWFLAGIVFVVLEMLAPGVFLFWLGLAAFATGFLILIGLAIGYSLSQPMQILLFACLSLVAVGLGRVVSHRSGNPLSAMLNRRADALLNRNFPLESAIAGGLGTIRVDDTLWRVSGPDLDQGQMVRVVGISGTKLQVEPFESA